MKPEPLTGETITDAAILRERDAAISVLCEAQRIVALCNAALDTLDVVGMPARARVAEIVNARAVLAWIADPRR